MSETKLENSDLFQVKLFVGFIATVIGVIILKELRSIFVPFFMALLLYFLFNGVVKRLLMLRVPMVFILVFLLVFIFIMFYFFGVLIYSGASSFISNFHTYSGRITELLRGLFDQLKIPIADVNKYLDSTNWTQSIDTSVITSVVSSTFGSFANFVGNLLLVLIFLMFMLAGRNTMTDRVHKAFEHSRADKIKFILNSIEDQVQHYLLIKSFISLLTGTLCAIIMLIGGMDFVIFSALLIFVLNFIPNIGSIIATLFPILMGVLKYGFSLRVFLVTGGLMLTQFIIGNVVEPKITGKSLNLSPIIIVISLIFWGYIWGIVGMMLAIPLTSALKIFFQNVPILHPLAELISAESKP